MQTKHILGGLQTATVELTVNNNSAPMSRLSICLTPMCALFLKFPKQFQEGDYYPHITVDETQLKE